MGKMVAATVRGMTADEDNFLQLITRRDDASLNSRRILDLIMSAESRVIERLSLAAQKASLLLNELFYLP